MHKTGRRRRRRKPQSDRGRASRARRDEKPRPVRPPGLGLKAGVGLATATLGAGIVLHVRGWPALGSESGGHCGGRFGGACPQGLTAVLLLAFGLSFGGFLAMVILLNAKDKRTESRPRPPTARGPGRLWIWIAVVGLLAGIWPGVLLYDALRGHHLEVRWSAPPDRPSGVTGAGTWVHDDLVVRARVDRLTAYAVGRTAWTMEIPGRDAVCTMSRYVEDGVGLVAWAADDQPCATVVAVDLRTGRPLWQRTRSADDRYGALVTADELAVAGEVAVFTEPTGLRAVGLRENDERWRLDVEEGCAPTGVAASADQVAMLVGCGDADGRVVAVDPRTGRELWRAELPPAKAVLVAARPVVVHAVEEGSRGENVFISYSDEGQVRARIPRSGPDYDMPEYAASGWHARPVRQVAVWGDRLVAPVSAPGDDGPTAVAAFSLASGAQLWRTAVEDRVAAFSLEAGELLVSTPRLRLYELSADGEITVSVPVRGDWWVYEFDLRKVGDAYAVVAEDGVEEPPVMMVG